MKPLDDIRIIALEQYGAGPFGSVHLADLGADVIKIEDPSHGGDVARYVPPFQEESDSLFFETFNRNKRSMRIDMAIPEGRLVFEDLVRTADAVYSNLRGDVPAKLRIRYDDLKDVNPMIVCVSISGFGMTGPRAAQPGYDYIIQGLAGWMALTGEPDGPPTKSGLSLVDYSGGLVGALSLLAAVHSARRQGIGCDCDISLYDVAMGMLTYPATWHLNGDWQPERASRSAHPSLVPFQLFRGSDQEWFLVACPKEKFWARLVECLAVEELLDPAFATFSDRAHNRDRLVALLDDFFATRPAHQWVEMLEEAGVPTGPVLDLPAALDEPHAEARGLLIETDHPRFGRVRQIRSPVRVGTHGEEGHRRAPQLGEDEESILEDVLGYSEVEINRLRERGIFG